MIGRSPSIPALLALTLGALALAASCASRPADRDVRTEADWAAGFAGQAARIEKALRGLDPRTPVLPRGVSRESLAATAVSAAWFGYDRADATGALRDAIASGASTVVVPDMGSPWILSSTIDLRSGLELVFAQGVRVEAAAGAFLGTGECLFEAIGVSSVSVSGYGATWAMGGPAYASPPYEQSQWRHALSLRGVKGFSIAGLRIESSGGDGVYVGSSAPRGEGFREPCEDLVLRDLDIAKHRRQGISVIAARGLLIERCRISETGGTAPGAGIDFEPNSRDSGFSSCVVRDCVLAGNEGPAILVALGRLRDNAPPVGLLVESSVLRGRPIAFSLFAARKSHRGRIEFAGCMLSGIRLTRPRGGVEVVFADR